MSAELSTTDRVSVQQALTVSGANTAAFRSGKPMDIKRVVAVVTTALTGTVGVANFGVRNRDGSSSVTIGTMTFPNLAVNAVLSAEVAGVKTSPVVNSGETSQSSLVTTGKVDGYYTNLPAVIKVNPGQEFFVTLTTPAGAGVVDIAIEYQEEANQQTRFNPTQSTVTFS